MEKRKECNNQPENLVSWLVELGGSLSPSLFLHHEEDDRAGIIILCVRYNVSLVVNKIYISGVRVRVRVVVTLTIIV